MWYIYALRLPGSYEYRYVGLTTKAVSERLSQHIKEARSPRNTSRPVLKWLRKHNFYVQVDILEEVPEDWNLLTFREQFWIASLRESKHALLNMTDGGDGAPNSKGRWKDRAGRVYGNLTVIEVASFNPVRWRCLCTCGKICLVRSSNLTSGNTTTCGKCISGKICSLPDCFKPRYQAQQYCSTHYMRKYRYGSFEPRKV